jgi:5-methylcytosine-specific restriction endonuclease McrA
MSPPTSWARWGWAPVPAPPDYLRGRGVFALSARQRGNDPRLKTAKRARLRAEVKALGLPCWLCGQPIDYTARKATPWSYVLDEIVPRWRGGDPEDRANVAPAHWRCNARRGQQVTAAKLRTRRRHRSLAANAIRL